MWSYWPFILILNLASMTTEKLTLVLHEKQSHWCIISCQFALRLLLRPWHVICTRLQTGNAQIYCLWRSDHLQNWLVWYSVSVYHVVRTCMFLLHWNLIVILMQPSMGILTLPCPQGRQAFGVNWDVESSPTKIEVGWHLSPYYFWPQPESAPYLSVGYGESLP